MKIKLIDSLPIGKAAMTAQGFLTANVRVARVGVQDYLANEVGLKGSNVVKVDRPKGEVFDPKSLATYKNVPLTMGHPVGDVTSSNWKGVSIGSSGVEVNHDGQYVQVDVVVNDADAIAAILNGTQELSVGYDCTIEHMEGVGGIDAIQRDIVVNHIAVVEAGRAGSSCRIGITDNKVLGGLSMVKIKIMDTEVEVTEQVAEAFKAKDKAIEVAEAKLSLQAETAAAKEAELATELTTLKDAALSQDDIDAMVTERGEVLAVAKDLKVKDHETMGNDAIKLAVCVAKYPAMKLADKGVEYVEGIYASVVSEVQADKGKDPMKVKGKIKDGVTLTPYETYMKDLGGK